MSAAPEQGKEPERAPGEVALDQEGRREFDDPKREWRRIAAELWGTFLLTLVGAGGHIAGQQSDWAVIKGLIEMAPGLIVMVAIYSLGSISGAHINPAVTTAFALRGNFPWKRVPGYILAQMVGGTLAVFFLAHTLNVSGTLGATVPHEGAGFLQVIAIEAVLTMGLVSTILATASGARNIGKLGALAVGGYIAAAGIWASPLTGASMNPARSLGPDIVRGDFSSSLIYIIGPLAGAAFGVALTWLLKGRPTREGTKQAGGEDNFRDK